MSIFMRKGQNKLGPLEPQYEVHYSTYPIEPQNEVIKPLNQYLILMPIIVLTQLDIILMLITVQIQ